MALLGEVTALPVARLEIQDAFSTLTKRERLQIYYATRAALGCSRVALKQVSLESPAIFDIIVELGRACGCNWTHLASTVGIDTQTTQQFLLYAARIVNSLGNYEVCPHPILTLTPSTAAKENHPYLQLRRVVQVKRSSLAYHRIALSASARLPLLHNGCLGWCQHECFLSRPPPLGFLTLED